MKEEEGEPRSSALSCAICFDPLSKPVDLPCCGRGNGSTSTEFCEGCIETICLNEYSVGKCPRCRKFIKAERAAGGRLVVSSSLPRARCPVCRQVHEIVSDGLCSSCLVGTRFVFLYECSRCQRFQRIPHPMYRYQSTPADYSSSTWACRRCQDYTTWRISRHDIGKIPSFDLPDSWDGVDAFESTRERRRQQQRGEEQDGWLCVLM